MTKAQQHMADLYQLATDMVRVKGEAGRLGLYRTMHDLDVATNTVGWEIAEMLTAKKQKLGQDQKEPHARQASHDHEETHRP